MILWCYDIPQNLWTLVNPTGDIPTPRHNHSAILFDSKIWIFGGTNEDSVLNDLYVYDITQNSFLKISNANVGVIAPFLHGHSATLYAKPGENAKMLIFGGGYWKDNQRCYMNQIYSYDLIDNQWSILEVTGDIPCGRSFHSTCLYEDCLLIFGGWWMTGDGRSRKEFYTNEILVFDLLTNTWKQHKPTIHTPGPRNRHSWVALDKNRFIVYGGNYYDQKNRKGYFYNNMYYVIISKDQNKLSFKWQEILGDTPTLSHHHAFIFENKLCVGMGEVRTHKLHNMYWISFDQ